MMKRLSFTCLLLASLAVHAATAPKRQFYEIRIYHIAQPDQADRLHRFLKDAYLPALHRAGIAHVGVFTPIAADTTYAGKRIVVLIPYQTVEQFTTLNQTLEKDKQYQTAGRDYIDAPYTTPPYSRIETILLEALADAPVMAVPSLKGAQPDRIYELRSYEGHTEKISRNKIHMFNEGGEIKLFQRLGFNAVFYAEVLAGANRPNFMYMTSFDNRASREEHWKTFTEDPEWKKLLAAPEYKNNMLKNTQYLLNAAAYSDI